MNTEIKELVMKDFERMRPEIQKRLDKAEIIGRRLHISFMDSAGVICAAICEFAPRKIIGISVPMARTGIVDAEWLHKTTAYCDDVVYEIINLDSEHGT